MVGHQLGQAGQECKLVSAGSRVQEDSLEAKPSRLICLAACATRESQLMSGKAQGSQAIPFGLEIPPFPEVAHHNRAKEWLKGRGQMGAWGIAPSSRAQSRMSQAAEIQSRPTATGTFEVGRAAEDDCVEQALFCSALPLQRRFCTVQISFAQ